MEPSQRTRIKTSPEDFPVFETFSTKLRQIILSIFPLLPSVVDTWPYRHNYTVSDKFNFEFIFSQMGSFTIRGVKYGHFRKNPTVIFYMSVGKYSDGSFIWEDENSALMNLEKESLKESIQKKISLFIET